MRFAAHRKLIPGLSLPIAAIGAPPACAGCGLRWLRSVLTGTGLQPQSTTSAKPATPDANPERLRLISFASRPRGSARSRLLVHVRRAGCGNPLAGVGGMSFCGHAVPSQSNIGRSSAVFGIHDVNFSLHLHGSVIALIFTAARSLNFHIGTIGMQHGPRTSLTGAICPRILDEVCRLHA